MGLIKKMKSTANSAIDKGKDIYSKLPSMSLRKRSQKDYAPNQRLEKVKKIAFNLFSGIDYDAVIKNLSVLKYLNPKLGIALLLIEKIKAVFDNYNRSKSEDKEQKLSKQLLSISKEFKISEVIDILLPFSKKIPYGKAIVIGLRLLSVFTVAKNKK